MVSALLQLACVMWHCMAHGVPCGTVRRCLIAALGLANNNMYKSCWEVCTQRPQITVLLKVTGYEPGVTNWHRTPAAVQERASHYQVIERPRP
jgi:hypothetical protein